MSIWDKGKRLRSSANGNVPSIQFQLENQTFKDNNTPIQIRCFLDKNDVVYGSAYESQVRFFCVCFTYSRRVVVVCATMLLPSNPNLLFAYAFRLRGQSPHFNFLRNQFLETLHSSCLFTPLISEQLLHFFACLTPWSSDNVLLQWEVLYLTGTPFSCFSYASFLFARPPFRTLTLLPFLTHKQKALHIHAHSHIHITPILIGTTTPEGGYKKFNGWDIELPNVYLRGSKKTVKQIVGEVLKLQGVFVGPEEEQMGRGVREVVER